MARTVTFDGVTVDTVARTIDFSGKANIPLADIPKWINAWRDDPEFNEQPFPFQNSRLPYEMDDRLYKKA